LDTRYPAAYNGDWSDFLIMLRQLTCVRLPTIEYFRLNNEYLRNSFDFKKNDYKIDLAKRLPPIFNFDEFVKSQYFDFCS
jgi:hypothetical protein